MVDLPRRHLHTLPHGTTLPDATAAEEGFPFLLEDTGGSATRRTLYQSQGGAWVGLSVCPPPPTQVSTDYTLVTADAGATVEVNGSSSVTITVPSSGSAQFPIGATVTVLNLTSNPVTVVGEGGFVTVNSLDGNTALAGQWAQAVLRQRDTDQWVLTGDLA